MALHKTNKTAHVLNLLATGEPEPDHTETTGDKQAGPAGPGRAAAGQPAPPPKQPEAQGLAPNISIVKTDDGADPLADLIRASLSQEILKESSQEPDEGEEEDEAPPPSKKKAPAKPAAKKTAVKKKAPAKAPAEPEEDEADEEAEEPAPKATKAKKAPVKRAAAKKAVPQPEPDEEEEGEETEVEPEEADEEPEEADEEPEDENTEETEDEGPEDGEDALPSPQGGQNKTASQKAGAAGADGSSAGDPAGAPPAAVGGLAFEDAMAAAESNAKRAHAHGYPGDSPEAAFFSATAPTEDSYCYVNMMEMIVDDRLLEFMNRFGLCTCDRCVLDTKALALANLPPKYIVAPIESLPPLLSFYKNKYSLNVITELTKACLAVLDNPRH